MSFLKFPKNFLWGGALSAVQIESTDTLKGAKTNWDLLYQKDPKSFYNSIGPGRTCDHLKHYKEDLKLFASIGANSFRTGLMWSRLFPQKGVLDQKAVAFYHDYLDEAIKNKLNISITLNHFDLPDWAILEGGYESSEIIEEFIKYADFIMDEYGNKIDMLFSFNEPMVPIVHGYLNTLHMPAVYNPQRAIQSAYGTILAHAKVANLFYSKYALKIRAKFGIILNIMPSIALDGINASVEDKKAAYNADLLLNDSMFDAMVLGKFNPDLISILKTEKLIPKYSKEELEIIKKSKVDIIGINYYHPSRVKAPQKNASDFDKKYFQFYNWDKARKNIFRGWEILPKSIYDIAMLIKNKYNNIPFFISENGMGVQNEEIYRDSKTKIINDTYRIAYIQEHLEWIHKAIQDGANCFGYHMWAMMDNWSFKNAFKNRYGFIEIDLETMERRVKKSALWLKKTASENGFDSNYKKLEEVIDLKKTKFIPSL